jgi:hypothetical protein
MGKKTVSVIVVLCSADNNSIFGSRLIDTAFDTLSWAQDQAEDLKGTGVCVIIRPNYNERYDDGKQFFREWRSFNGEDFKECRWSTHL